MKNIVVWIGNGLRLIWYLIFLPCLFISLLYHFFVNFFTYLLCAVSPYILVKGNIYEK